MLHFLWGLFDNYNILSGVDLPITKRLERFLHQRCSTRDGICDSIMDLPLTNLECGQAIRRAEIDELASRGISVSTLPKLLDSGYGYSNHPGWQTIRASIREVPLSSDALNDEVITANHNAFVHKLRSDFNIGYEGYFRCALIAFKYDGLYFPHDHPSEILASAKRNKPDLISSILITDDL